MTYPLIGNYGVKLEDTESENAQVRGFIVREKCDASSNFRSEIELENYLKQHRIMVSTLQRVYCRKKCADKRVADAWCYSKLWIKGIEDTDIYELKSFLSV